MNTEDALVVVDETYAMDVEKAENVKKCFGKALRIIGEKDLVDF